jgi:hypothetical protein
MSAACLRPVFDHPNIRHRGSIPGRGERKASVSRPAVGPTQPPVQWVPGVFSAGLKRDRGVTLTTHPHLVPRSRMSSTYTPLPQSAYVACRGTALAIISGEDYHLWSSHRAVLAPQGVTASFVISLGLQMCLLILMSEITNTNCTRFDTGRKLCGQYKRQGGLAHPTSLHCLLLWTGTRGSAALPTLFKVRRQGQQFTQEYVFRKFIHIPSLSLSSHA